MSLEDDNETILINDSLRIFQADKGSLRLSTFSNLQALSIQSYPQS